VICILEVGDVPSGYVLVTVSSRFSSGKNSKGQNSTSCTKKKLILVSTRNGNISRGVQQQSNFRRGGGGAFCEPILENPEGRGIIGKIPSMGGMDISWNYTITFLAF